jgi:hypothetical protein
MAKHKIYYKKIVAYINEHLFKLIYFTVNINSGTLNIEVLFTAPVAKLDLKANG